MLKLLPYALLALATVNAPAATLTCQIASGPEEKTASVNPEKPASEPAYSDYVYDLSFLLEANCEWRACRADITVLSQQVEDEVGSTSFAFNLDAAGEVFAEPLTHAPDGRDYRLRCTLR